MYTKRGPVRKMPIYNAKEFFLTWIGYNMLDSFLCGRDHLQSSLKKYLKKSELRVNIFIE